jgi:hypothetical protein
VHVGKKNVGCYREGDMPTAAYEKPLRESLEDASVLLWYATREGKQLSREAISDIVEAQSTLTPGTRNAEVEGRFWAALRELAAAVKPASVDSILATYNYPFGHHAASGKGRLVDANRTKKNYRIGAISVLSVLIVIQIWWFAGTTIRADLEKNRNELDNIVGSLRALDLSMQDLDILINDRNEGIYDSMINIKDGYRISAGNQRDLQKTINRLTIEVDSLKNQKTQTSVDYNNAKNRARRVTQALQGDMEMIEWLIPDLSGSPSKSSKNSEREHDDVKILYTDNLQNPEKFIQEIENMLFTANAIKVELNLLNSQTALGIFTQYVLPLLYGLLGAQAYILRTLSREIQNVTFTRGSEIRYSLRWPLGMLAGVTVGLFFDPADLSGIAAVTPLGLAFLAGYGVELVFTGLDRMVSAFAGDGGERPKVA